MASQNLLQSFEEMHPIFPVEDKDNALKKGSNASSQTTLDQNPPRVLESKDVKFWVDVANKFLNTAATRYPQLKTKYIASPDPSALETESDAVQLARMLYINPVLVVAEAIYPTMLRLYTEDTARPLRLDLVVKKKMGSGPVYRDVVMLIEFKRCWMIHHRQFETAMSEAGPEAVKSKLAELEDAHKFSSLVKGTNAFWFAKQATAYALKTRCKFAALCDYEHLILLHFQDLPDITSAQCTIVPRECFRKALLGFLLMACEESGL